MMAAKTAAAAPAGTLRPASLDGVGSVSVDCNQHKSYTLKLLSTHSVRSAHNRVDAHALARARRRRSRGHGRGLRAVERLGNSGRGVGDAAANGRRGVGEPAPDGGGRLAKARGHLALGVAGYRGRVADEPAAGGGCCRWFLCNGGRSDWSY